MSQIFGYRADCEKRFNDGQTVSVLCKADDGRHGFLYRLIVRKRGMARSRIIN